MFCPEQYSDLLVSFIKQNAAQAIELQRYLHEHPELSNGEYETTKFIANRLTSLGYELYVRPEGVGLYADLKRSRGVFDIGVDVEPLPILAFRADIDALPIEEKTGLPYQSKNQGVMHACGHDVHTATLLAFAAALVAYRDQLPIDVRLIFQHAEEITAHGAFELIEFGALDGVGAILSLHADPSRYLGCIGVRDGAFTASYDAFTIRVYGKAGHGARPHQSIDTVYLMTKIATALYEVIGRTFDARDPAVLSIGQMSAGCAANAIPGEGVLSGTIRTLSREQRALVQPMLRQITEGVCLTHGGNVDLHIEVGSPPVVNDPTCTDWIRQAGYEELGKEAVDEIDKPSMGSEDFAHYLRDIPGSMFRLGVLKEGAPETHLHANNMIAESESVIVGASIYARAMGRAVATWGVV